MRKKGGELMSPTMESFLESLKNDPNLKRRFLADPGAVLAERGIPVPAGVTLKVLEDSEETNHIVLPYAKEGGKPNLEVLEQRAAKIILPP
jgi:hypothetical protein